MRRDEPVCSHLGLCGTTACRSFRSSTTGSEVVMVTPEVEAEVRRLFFGEHLSVGEAASALGVHRDVVVRAIGPDAFTKKGCERPSALDEWMPFLRDMLERYPTMTGSRLHQMLRQRGYQGSVIQVRRRIIKEGLRASRKEAFFEL
jgi:hypothetical protein